MGLFYVRVDVRSHVNNGPLNNLCIVCMWRCIVSWCSFISPCEWCGSWKWVTVSLVMAMARRTWSVATGLARDTLGENLTCPTPSKDCFFCLVSYVVFGCFYLPPERFRTVQNGEWTVQGYSPWKRHDGLQLWVYFGLLWAMSFTWSLTWTATWTLTCLEVGVCWPQT